MNLTAIQRAIGIPYDRTMPRTLFSWHEYVRSGGPSTYLGKPRPRNMPKV
jgi:hypothetical protein